MLADTTRNRGAGRGFAAAAVISLVTLACARVEVVPPRETPQPAPPVEASASVAVSTAAPGTTIEVSGEGYPANTTVEIGVGQPASSFAVVTTTNTDGQGRVATAVTVPEWAMRGLPYVAVINAPTVPARAVTAPFVVGAPGDSVRVQGELTGEGVECPALRGPAGELYTLAVSELEYGVGTQVRVRGTIAEAAICMQGTVLQVESIERVPGGSG